MRQASIRPSGRSSLTPVRMRGVRGGGVRGDPCARQSSKVLSFVIISHFARGARTDAWLTFRLEQLTISLFCEKGFESRAGFFFFFQNSASWQTFDKEVHSFFLNSAVVFLSNINWAENESNNCQPHQSCLPTTQTRVTVPCVTSIKYYLQPFFQYAVDHRCQYLGAGGWLGVEFTGVWGVVVAAGKVRPPWRRPFCEEQRACWEKYSGSWRVSGKLKSHRQKAMNYF